MVQWLWEDTHDLKIMCLNPFTIYQTFEFSHFCVVKMYWQKMTKNKRKEADDVQLFLFKFNSYALTTYRQFFHRDIFDTFLKLNHFKIFKKNFCAKPLQGFVQPIFLDYTSPFLLAEFNDNISKMVQLKKDLQKKYLFMKNCVSVHRFCYHYSSTFR